MPQMAPINWLILFLYFMMMLYLIMNMMYFNFYKNIKMKQIKPLNKKNYNKFI
uniref:ATP synthase complex subunit 8 n=1 Tax=Hamamelistes spinosus TaxID=133091 RepID=A0A7L7S878_9HEMI|nr:ATP synthase F0 subunit 8 [Hamamelistes spinosus]QNV49433.1 ATP synthase F0 subunit 8 [Hamamelistes spinosus]